MIRQKSFEQESACLYIVSTPIGNLQEMTPRAIETLKNVSLIACEDTRVTLKLLNAFNISTPLLSHHAHNQESSILKIMDVLLSGQSVALVSDAGTPLISDPGNQLVNCVVKSGFPVIPISGSCALISALVASNLVTQPFVFYGFLPSTGKQLRKTLLSVKLIPYTLIFYLSVHKLSMNLKEMMTILGDRNICLAREMTKKHEEFLRGKISEILQLSDELKGEFVCIVEGNPHEKEPDLDESSVFNQVQQYIDDGYSASQAIKAVALELNISKNIVYKIYHQAGGAC